MRRLPSQHHRVHRRPNGRPGREGCPALGALPLPPGAESWKGNTRKPLGLTAFVRAFYQENAWTDETSLLKQRGFVTGICEGWTTTGDVQQWIAVAEFATSQGAASELDEVISSWSEQPAPDKVFTDPADGATGLTDPTLDLSGNAFTDMAARTGPVVIEVQEFTASAPQPILAKALLQQQLRGVKDYETGKAARPA